jgi:hypothetical protein
MRSKYFEQTAACLRTDPTRQGYFLLTEPHLLYMSDEQADSYLEAMHDPDYTSSFHCPTVKLIESNLPEIFGDVGEAISLIDLGPGYPDKSIPMAKYLKEHSVRCTYIPVDISHSFLEIAAGVMSPFVARVHPIHATFEACSEYIPSSACQHTMYCMIGLTFMNFMPDQIMPLLKEISRDRGRVIIASELVTEHNSTEKILSSYRTIEAQQVGFGPLHNIGLASDELTYHPVFANGRVELQFRLNGNPNETLQSLGLRDGNIIVTAVSYRYREEEITALMQRYFKSNRIFLSMDGSTLLAVGEQ